MLLLGLFGLLGLIIAIVGIYAVMANSVAQRTAEIGVRLALGATPGGVLAMVLRHACLLILTGMAIGGLAAWYLSAAAASFLYEVRPTEPRAYAAALAMLAATALLASLLPARRAARVDPIVALRSKRAGSAFAKFDSLADVERGQPLERDVTLTALGHRHCRRNHDSDM